MGGATPRPASGSPTAPAPGQSMQQGSDYYQHLLNNQKQKVADTAAVQQAQDRPQQPPNRPGPTPPGFGGVQQGQMGPEGGRYQGAYDAYMQRFGGSTGTQQMTPPAPPQAPQPGMAPQPQQGSGFDQGRPPRRPGIRMGNGYASRD